MENKKNILAYVRGWDLDCKDRNRGDPLSVYCQVAEPAPSPVCCAYRGVGNGGFH